MRDFHLPGRSTVHAASGLCATSHPLAARAAIDVLERGGNAADAAIAGAALLGLCEPQMTGIGGDAFALVKPAGEERVVALNGSGRAPAALHAEALRAEGHAAVPDDHPASVTVPGAVDLFCRLSADWGRLGLAPVLAPAIRYAEEGVPVAPRTAFDWALAASRLQGAARRAYLLDGRAPRPGEVFRAPGQAEVLRRVAERGRAAFYEGEVAADIVAALRALGGLHTEADLAAAATDAGEPIAGAIEGLEMLEHPPNGQGATALLMAAILARHDLGPDPLSARRAHLEAEAARLAYDARDRVIADPERTVALERMLAPETAERLAALIDPARALPDARRAADAVWGVPARDPAPAGAHRETVYLTVVDRGRMAVSLIYSIYHAFGAGIATERFGILLHNRGAGFTLEPGHPNELAGGRRPMHTIIPAMLRREGRFLASFGVMGGAYQPAGHVRVATNLARYGMDPQEALDAPRSFPDGGALKLERGYPEAVRADLAAMGHRVETPETPLGGAQMALHDWETDTLVGASDPRKDGCALGC